MTPLFAALVWVGTSLALAGATEDAGKAAPKIGDPVGKVTFKDIRYVPRSLDDFRSAKAVVLVFTTTKCPIAQRYLPVLNRLDADYRERGVQFVAVNVGPDDSISDVAEQAVRHGAEFPFVKDLDGSCVRATGVTRTPEVVVLDSERRLRYRGRIDDQYRFGGARDTATRNDLREALDAVLACQEVAMKETPVDGCAITLSQPAPPPKPVTYSEHVAPLLKQHCTGCHRPGTVAPFSLTSYRAASARADAIAEVVAEERMPPWYASRQHGEFYNRRGLSTEERETIVAWARAGSPRGESKEPADPPAPDSAPASSEKAEQTEWRIGEPDLVITQQKPYELPAEGVIGYQYAILPHVFAHDTWVEAVQIKPDNHRVVHHCNMAYFLQKEGAKASNFITGVVPGGDPMVLDHNVALKIPQGTSLVLQIHYVTTGKPEKCEISVGLRYAREPIEKQLRHMRLADEKFAIPPGAPAHPVAASKTLDRDAIGIGLFAHMHLRGKDMTFLAHLPDGGSREMLMIPNYSFNWQHSYRWEFGSFRLPKDTRIECLAHFDNSAFNPYNPDPTATVKEGPQTFHEMMNGFVFYVDAHEQLNLSVDPKTGAASTQAAGR